MTDHAALQALDAHYRSMPPVAAMAIGIDGYDGGALRLRAPLSAHVNDKGCAFGGSLDSLMTLAGWGLVTLRLQSEGLAAEVYVADAAVRYRAPLYDDLVATARLADPQAWQAFVTRLRQRGRAGVRVAAAVALADGGEAAAADVRYVAILKS